MNNNTKIGDYTIQEWEELGNLSEESATIDNGNSDNNEPIQNTKEQPENIEQPPANSYATYGEEVGLNNHNEKLSIGETFADIGNMAVDEITRVVLPKSKEINYADRTNAAHNLRLLYRYGISNLLLAAATGGLGNYAAGIAAASKIGWLSKAGKAVQLAKQTKLLKGGALGANNNTLKGMKLGLTASNGLVGGAVADYFLYRPEEGMEHFADLLPQNEVTKYFQSDINDTEAEARFKEVLNGAVVGAAINLTFAPVVNKVLSKIFKNTKKLTKATNEKEAEQLVSEITVDEINLQNLTDKQDLFDYVYKTRQEALESGQDFETLLREKGIQGELLQEAKNINKIIAEGGEPFYFENGKISAQISKWEDFANFSEDEVKEQLTKIDNDKIKNEILQAESALNRPLTEDEVKVIRKKLVNSTAIEMQDKAVEDTWKQRGLLGTNENLINIKEGTEKRTVNNKAVNSILDYYKDKFKIDNKVKISFVNGLPDGAEGMIIAAKNTGKTAKTLINKIDKQKLKIEQIRDKITQLEGGNSEVTDPLDVLKEQLRIAENELKDLQTFLPDINVKIDINAKNPYATLRGELEHVNDIAHNQVPKDRHFNRYQGDNEGEVASGFVKHKADRKQEILAGEKSNDFDNNSYSSVKEKLKGYDFEYLSAEKQRYSEGYNPDIDDGYFPDTEYTDKIFMKDKQGKLVAEASLDYDGDIITPVIRNNGVKKGEARKIFAYLISHYPDRKIKWVATNDHSIKSYKHFCEEYPELAKKLEFEDKTKIDTNNSAVYNSEKGVVNETVYEQTQSPRNQYERRGNKRISKTEQTDGIRQSRISEIQGDSQGNLQGERKKEITESGTTSSSVRPEQLKLDFSNATPEEAIDGVVSGEKTIVATNIDSLISKIIDEDKAISGFKWKNIAEDAEGYVSSFLNSNEALRKAVTKGDVNTIERIVRRQLAANKAVSILYDKIQDLGLNATKEQRKEIIESANELKKYIKEVGSAAGGLLNAQKLNIRAKETFGKMALSDLEQTGLVNLADLLDKSIKKFYNLKFTRNKEEVVKSINAFIKELKGESLEVYKSILEDKEASRKLKQFFADCFVKGEGSKADIEKGLTEIFTDLCYERAFKTASLAPDKDSWLKTVLNYVYKNTGAYYVHNLLSGFGSTARNVFSGLINTVYYPAKKIVAGKFFGGGEELTQEGLLTYHNLINNIGESFELSRQAFLKGDGKFSAFVDDSIKDLSEEEVAKIARDSSYGFNEFKKPETIGEFFQQIQNFHSIMTRVMGASDEFMSQLNYRAVGRAKALLQAKNSFAGKVSDAELLAKANDYFELMFDKNTGLPTDFQTYNEVREMLYMNNLSGKGVNVKTGELEEFKPQTLAMNIGGKINSVANKNPVIKVLFPFLKSGVNILQMNLDHNLAYLGLSPDKKKLLLSKTKEGALLRSQAAFGIASFFSIVPLAWVNLITGAAPANPDEKKALFATGWKPYSIRYGDKFYSYQGIEPLHTQLGFAADCVRIFKEVKDPDKNKEVMSFVHEGFAALVNNFLDKAAFRSGLRQLQVLTSPDEFSLKSFEKIGVQAAQGFLPDVAMVRNLSTFGENDVKSPNNTYEKLFNRYLNSGLGDYRRDVFGNKQTINNLIVTQQTPDNKELPEYTELERLAGFGFYPTEINETLEHSNIKMGNFINPTTGQSALDAVKEKLTSLEIGGKTLQEAVRELVVSSDYQNMTDGFSYGDIKYSSNDKTKINAIRKIFVKYNNKARKEVINEYKDNLFIDKQGRTLKEAFEETEQLKIQTLENEGYTTEDWLMNF